MAQNGADGRLDRYLLGHLSPEEEERLEIEYLGDGDAFVRVQAAEDDLIDDYANGRLSADDEGRFRERFLDRPEMAERVAFARALAATPARPLRSSPRWLAAAAALFLAVSCGLLARLTWQERAAAAAAHAAVERVAALEARLSERESVLPVVTPPEPRRDALPAVVELRGGTNRGAAAEPNTIEAPSADWIQLRLVLAQHLYKSYSARLETMEERRLAVLPVVVRDAPPGADVMVPGALLKPGAYVVVLEGVRGGTREMVDGYTLEVRPAGRH
jgi:hypothetical protein